MTPIPQDPLLQQRQAPQPLDGDRVVITGMSGLYPESHNVDELSRILYNKENPVNAENIRWKYSHPEVGNHTGKVPGLDLFDAQFFKVHYRLAYSMDIMARKILEQTFQAIYDSGISPKFLDGKKVGVYIGTCFSETEKASFYVANTRTGFGIAGCCKAMFANRISYWMNAKGPSFSIDVACCSSTAAVEHAYLAIKRGDCEAAIVGGANVCLHPQSSVHYGRIMTLSKDGKTKSFDQNCEGVAKSEAINVLFMQKAKDAKRVYAEVVHVKHEFGTILMGETGPRYGFYRDPNVLANFIRQFYKEANISPQQVEYIEAFGSAVPEADKAELQAISDVYCKDRVNPLLIGSVMSNIGYTEAACGISAITKVLLGYHHGKLAANLHCETPRQDIPAIRDGRMSIITEHQPISRQYIAINSMSVTGVNAHVLLHGHYKAKDLNRYACNIPRLVTISGRQDTSVKKILDHLKANPVDPEQLALFHNLHKTNIPGHLGRGFTILDTKEGQTVSLVEKAAYFDDLKRPLWFVYSGMGSQWAGMGTQLMRIPIFAAAIERCRKVLEPKGVDIVHIITSTDKTIFDNILHSFVGIAAVQIGLTDILRALGLVPDKIIGHSVGELGCAYADGCFTAEEMILSAYSRGLVSVQTPFIRGSMAAVGIGYQQVKGLCPPEIEVACHNGQDSSTISGPSEIMKEFVAELTAKGIFAKEVPCSNIAYHSRYIAEAGPGLLKYLSEVIKDPKPRSERWVSTSVPMDRWNEPSAKYSSAEYHTNNLLNPVLFEETSSLIPPTAVLVEIAPHGLLQAILKRSLPVTCRHVPLTRRGHADNTLFLLEAIGKLYMDGYYPIVEAIYPKVEFPVSTGTPHLSHLVEWAHHEKWPLPLYVSAARKVAAACKFTISIHDEEYSYLEGHVIRGKTLLPFSAALIAAWDTLAMHLGKPRKSISVQYRDVELYAQPTIHDRRQLRLAVNLHRGTGRFEIMDDHFRVATGYINELAVDVDETYTSKNENTELTLQTEDVYQLLNDRDYSYRGDFQSIYNTNTEFTAATIKWSDNWATFIDGILQLCTLKHAHDTTSQPSHIRNLLIDVDIQKDSVVKKDSKLLVKAESFEVHDYTRCGGVIIESLRFHDLPHPKQNEIALKSLKFIPRFQEYTEWDIATTFNIFLQIVEENITTNVINVVGIVNYLNEDTWFKDIVDALETSADVKLQYTQINKDRLLDQRDHFVSDVKLVLVQDLCSDDDLCQHLYRVLPRGTFLVNGVMSDSPKTERPSSLFCVISAHKVDDMKLELVRWRPVAVTGSYSAVSVRSEIDLPILSNTRDSLPPQQKLIVLASYPPQNGLKDLVKLWKQDTDRNQIYVFMINEKNPDDQFFDQLPNLDLVFNVLNNGIWGGEYLVPCNVKLSVDRGVKMEIAQIGNIDSLRWVELSESTGYGIPVTVDYAGLNDIDVKNATGVLPFEHATESNQTYFGMDFSGRTDNGQRVMGLIQGGSVSRRVLAQPELLWPVPDHWSLEDAATVPLAYAIVYYCIGMRTNLLPSASVLVHGGAGALGQAAISVALACKCKVFTTVSDVRKKKFLKRLFPELRDEYIGNSRDASFGDMVLNATKGQGCDIVMSCVRGNLRNTALLCAGNSGFVFDTVKISSQENYMFGMYHLTKERSYVSVDLSTLFTLKDTETMNRLQTFISEGISSGFVRPLSRVTFDGDEAPRAFRLIAASRHRGRVLLRIPDGKDNAEPRLNVSSGHTHMIISHNDYLAVRLAEKLVSRGVKKIYFHTETPTGYLQLKAKSLKALGVQIEVSSQSIADHNGVSNFLNKTSQLGLVEGIYVVAGDVIKNDSVLATFISNIDLVAKKSCPTLRYFAVLNPVNSIGQQTCISRNLNKLPATMIQLPALAKEQPSDSSSKQYTTWRDIIDATERALCTNEPVVSVSLQKDTPISLLEEIAAIADINIPEEVDENATLEELGLPLEKNCILCAYLKDAHNVFYSGETVQFLTIQKIKEIEATLYPTEYKKQKGLNTFINYVDPDELLATTELVFLPTLTNNATMRDDEFDIGQKYLCLLPGLEGHHYKFEALCERLKLPALVLQPGLDNLYESIQEQAQRYAKILLQRSEIKDSYYLLGYESGALAALETAAILEDHGLTGTIFCVGCALDELQTILNNELSEYETEEQLQDAVLKHMVDIMSYGENIENLDNLLKTETSWKSKIDMCVRKLLGRVSHSAQYARAQIEAVYARIQQVKNYRAIPHKLQSKIVLIRAASDNTMPTHSLLQQFSHQPVAVHLLKNSLEFSTKDLRCASIINQYLDPEILEAYEQKNLCETYLLNADTFMSTVEDGV